MHVFSRPLILLLFILPMLGLTNPFHPSHPNFVGTAPMDVGYFIDHNILDDSFFHYKMVTQYFQPAKYLSPYEISPSILSTFNPIITSIETYIVEQKKGEMAICEENPSKCKRTFAFVNGITEKELATEIVKASYCFGTDPFLVTSKIRQESRFDMMAVSSTGAVGLTQLTMPGIKEILDQMGHRGEKYAYLNNRQFIEAAITCYSQNSMKVTLRDFPQIQTYKSKTNGIEYSGETLRLLKAWILPSRKTPVQDYDKLTHVQRQIFMGQILLKIYLAYSKKARPDNPMLNHYNSALKMFNGDDIRVQYAKEVIKFSKQANTL